jgi:hypothetical protein
MGHADCPNPKWTPTQNVVQLYLDSINNTIPSKGMSLDELNDEREQAVNDLPSEHPDPKLVLPTLIRHLKSDPDEGVRYSIAWALPSISKNKDVITALNELANEKVTNEEREKGVEEFKKDSSKVSWSEEYTLQGTALASLARAGSTEAIPELADWLKKYNINMFKWGFPPNTRKSNEKFMNDCIQNIESRMTDESMTNKDRLRLVRGEIISLNQQPDKFKKYFVDSLNDKDEGTVEEALDAIQEIQKQSPEWIKDHSGKEFINYVEPQLKSIKIKKFESKIKTIINNKGK